jgi:hypothetical protein
MIKSIPVPLRILALAIVIEACLAVLAVFGGPHGALGGWPWALQLPGILVVLLIPGEGGFAWRASGMIVIQIACWYGICYAMRRLLTKRAA